MDDITLRRTALVVVTLSSLVTPLMLASVNVAIPTIAAAFSADAVAISWISTGYLLASAVFLLPIGRLADMYGRKRVFLAGMVTVTVADENRPLAEPGGAERAVLRVRSAQAPAPLGAPGPPAAGDGSHLDPA